MPVSDIIDYDWITEKWIVLISQSSICTCHIFRTAFVNLCCDLLFFCSATSQHKQCLCNTPSKTSYCSSRQIFQNILNTEWMKDTRCTTVQYIKEDLLLSLKALVYFSSYAGLPWPRSAGNKQLHEHFSLDKTGTIVTGLSHG